MSPREFIKDTHGNVAMMFGLTIIPILACLGAAIDYGTLIDARAKMQAALDATVLALSSEARDLTSDQLSARATAVFNANFNANSVSDAKVNITFTRNNGANLTATASGTVDLAFMKLVGYSQSSIGASSQSAWSTTNLRVALALDNTGSMSQSGKLTALKQATHNLLDMLQKASSKDGDVYVSIIPFAKDVNVGTANKSATWIDWYATCDNPNYCGNSYYMYPYRNNQGTVTSSYKGYWNGCVADRQQNYDIGAAAPDTSNTKTLFPAEQDSYCPSTLTPLTYNWTTLSSAVDAMAASGGTNQTIGLAWAWQSLMSTAPLNAPVKDTGIDYEDIIILLSDGKNTWDRWYGNGTETSGNASAIAKVDARMSAACTAAKSAGVVIYTVLVIDGDESLLQGCASSSDKYFKVTQSSDIITTFGVIGDQLTKLHLSQ